MRTALCSFESRTSTPWRHAVLLSVAILGICAAAPAQRKPKDKPTQAPSPAEPAPTAALVAQPGRSIAHALDMFFMADLSEPRTLLLLVEPSATVAAAGFAQQLDDALLRHAEVLQKARIGMALLSDKKGGLDAVHKPLLPRAAKPGQAAAHETLGAALTEKAKKATRGDQQKVGAPVATYDFHAALLSAVQLFPRAPGPRRILVVAFDSAEAEGDIEGAAKALEENRISADFLTVEATFSDSYWRQPNRNNYLFVNFERLTQRPASGSLVGGDGPVQDLPAGFLFQLQEPTCITPSGYAPYAMSRVAYVTRGRTFLYAAPTNEGHRCDHLSYGCRDCADEPAVRKGGRWQGHDHKEDYTAAQLQAMAPSVLSRTEARDLLSRDPWARAVRKAWGEAYAAGIVATRPSGSAASQEVRRQLLDPDPAVHLPILEEMLGETIAIADELEGRIDQLGAVGQPRQRAIAHYTLAMLRLTQASLLKLRAFSHSIPERLKELETRGPLGKVRGEGSWYDIAWDDHNSCHGVAGHLRREPEGESRAALARLSAFLPRLEALAEHSPIWWAFHRASYPDFRLRPHYANTSPTPNKPRPNSEPDPGPTTPLPRPRPGSSSPSGPTTGGGR